MITRGYLNDNLQRLDKLYNESSNKKDTVFHSKLALLELCGWIEESMDNIVAVYAKKKLKLDSFKKLHVKIVDNNYGFKYKENFRPMIIQTIGIMQAEKLESQLNKSGKIDILSGQLGALNKLRNDAAHTFIKGTTKSYDAPSSIISRFQIIYPILVEIDKEFRKL